MEPEDHGDHRHQRAFRHSSMPTPAPCVASERADDIAVPVIVLGEYRFRSARLAEASRERGRPGAAHPVGARARGDRCDRPALRGDPARSEDGRHPDPRERHVDCRARAGARAAHPEQPRALRRGERCPPHVVVTGRLSREGCLANERDWVREAAKAGSTASSRRKIRIGTIAKPRTWGRGGSNAFSSWGFPPTRCSGAKEFGTVETVAEMARTAESLGYQGVYVTDHPDPARGSSSPSRGRHALEPPWCSLWRRASRPAFG